MLKTIRTALLAFAGLLFATSALAAPVNMSTATTALITAAATGKPIRVMSFMLVAAGTTTVKFEYGTQTTNPCDTGTTALTGAMSMAANTQLALSAPSIPLMNVPQSNQLCLVQTGAVQLSGFVATAQP